MAIPSLAWRAVLVVMAAAVLVSGGCGGGSEEDKLAGTYVSMAHPKDSIELLPGGKARVVAIEGRSIDVWETPGTATGIARQMQVARQATTNLETVEGTYKVISPSVLKIDVPGRGSRTLQFNAEAGTLQSPGRNYLSRK